MIYSTSKENRLAAEICTLGNFHDIINFSAKKKQEKKTETYSMDCNKAFISIIMISKYLSNFPVKLEKIAYF